MHRFRSIRRIHIAAVLAILLSWAFPFVVEFVQLVQNNHGADTVVQVTAIHGSESQTKICHHHLEGCPKTCFCPNTAHETEMASEPVEPEGRIYVPALVECSELAFDSVFHSSPVFLNEARFKLPMNQLQTGKLRPLSPQSPRPPFLDPVSKIPIA